MTRDALDLPAQIGALAARALRAEAALSPKPGLVTPHSQGAHRDMDFGVFLAAAAALAPCFTDCARAGAHAASRGVPLRLEEIRPAGLAGERSMYRATGGVNTHKGAIFCLGVLSAALPLALERETTHLGEAACDCAAELCADLVERDLGRAPGRIPGTPGERLFRERGVRGARGEAEAGYPLLRKRLLPRMRQAGHPGSRGFEIACLDVLLLSMRELVDSCLLKRGGPWGLVRAQQGAARVLDLGGAGTHAGMRALRELDRAMSEAGLSPGGSADMLAAALFLSLAERESADWTRCKEMAVAVA